MIAINNVQSLTAAQLTDILKTEFPAFVNGLLGSNLAVEFAHVSDFVNVGFPEVIEGNAYTVTVGDGNLELTDHTTGGTYDAQLLEEHLLAFLMLKVE
jgi:hypothetical protein